MGQVKYEISLVEIFRDDDSVAFSEFDEVEALVKRMKKMVDLLVVDPIAENSRHKAHKGFENQPWVFAAFVASQGENLPMRDSLHPGEES